MQNTKKSKIPFRKKLKQEYLTSNIKLPLSRSITTYMQQRGRINLMNRAPRFRPDIDQQDSVRLRDKSLLLPTNHSSLKLVQQTQNILKEKLWNLNAKLRKCIFPILEYLLFFLTLGEDSVEWLSYFSCCALLLFISRAFKNKQRVVDHFVTMSYVKHNCGTALWVFV